MRKLQRLLVAAALVSALAYVLGTVASSSAARGRGRVPRPATAASARVR